eukprot:1174318-Rhodomonas_salina.2
MMWCLCSFVALRAELAISPPTSGSAEMLGRGSRLGLGNIVDRQPGSGLNLVVSEHARPDSEVGRSSAEARLTQHARASAKSARDWFELDSCQ